MKDIAIYGAGGFGREVACLIERINKARETPIWNFFSLFSYFIFPLLFPLLIHLIYFLGLEDNH